ncbi:MAG: glycosyltransferase, partial [Trebonia sp.]
MTGPTVSVVITCFNYACWLPEAVTSVLDQTLADLELLIVDDGSSDDSLAVAHRLAEGDDRITVISQPNSGQPAIPRNRAIARARGRYVVSLDADDKLAPETLELCAAALDDDPAVGMAYAGQHHFGATEQWHAPAPWSLDRLKHANFLNCATMFRHAAWEAAGGYSTNVRGYEDWDLWLGIAQAGYVGRPVPEATFHYRIHSGGVYDQSTERDQTLKAQVVVNRSGLYGDGVLGWARGVLAGDQDRMAIPHQRGIVPRCPDPPHPLRVSRDPAERADWHVLVEGLQGPWPERSLAESLAAIDTLGYTAVEAGGAIAARRRGTDPIVCPAPFFVTATADRDRSHALAEALDRLLVVSALRANSPADAHRTAAYAGVSEGELLSLVEETQTLLRDGGPVPIVRSQPISRIANVLAGERALAGDADAASRARALVQTAARAGLEQARPIAILAFADELIATPGMLRAYGDTISSDDPVTLVIVTDDPEPLIAAVAAAGLSTECSADLIAVD